MLFAFAAIVGAIWFSLETWCWARSISRGGWVNTRRAGAAFLFTFAFSSSLMPRVGIPPQWQPLERALSIVLCAIGSTGIALVMNRFAPRPR